MGENPGWINKIAKETVASVCGGGELVFVHEAARIFWLVLGGVEVAGRMFSSQARHEVIQGGIWESERGGGLKEEGKSMGSTTHSTLHPGGIVFAS